MEEKIENTISEKDIRKWLAQVNGTNLKNIQNILKDEKATTYLMVWSVFEQNIFDGYMTKDKISNKAKEYSDKYELLNVDDIVFHFHGRYQDKENFNHLKHGDNNISKYVEILEKEEENLSSTEKLQLMLYVCFRYRNNIFHGNKGVLSWSKYTPQINNCINFMMALVNNS